MTSLLVVGSGFLPKKLCEDKMGRQYSHMHDMPLPSQKNLLLISKITRFKSLIMKQ